MISVSGHGLRAVRTRELTPASGQTFESVTIETRNGAEVALMMTRDELRTLFIALHLRINEIDAGGGR